ncbi:FAD-dependent oxidoreductase [Cyanobium sp. ATX 6F1]|uniref:FAD-dependent oxidoreductase n=2 Tax=unclassified Cyanobium TaxID=2627006 RepID=UPI0020CCD81C|nr:FAD-dependent oxidoreductase [Cyanobium sp. ATX 6F1]MCP9915663.1 FAD-dependent oxidoreductase [Cyanobium sp. ATX 6F1]
MNSPQSAPVVIVGAGPAGASLALQLARAGVPVTLIEAAKEFSRQFRGEALMPSGLGALAAMGLEALLAELPQRTLEGWSFKIEGRELFSADEPLGSARPCTLVAQGPLLEALVEQARALPGFTWLPGTAVADLIEHGGRISGVRLADGRCLEAALVVGSDGRRSLVRQRAGLALDALGSAIDVLWFRLPSAPEFERPNRFTTLVAQGQICSLFAGTTPGELQLGWVVSKGKAAATTDQRGPQDWCEAFAQLAPEPLARHLRQQAGALVGPVRLNVEVGRCPLWQRRGLLLLGDAAHPMSPVRAQGLNMALRDSLVAARLLTPLWSGGGPDPAALDGVLESIQAARFPEISGVQGLQAQEAARGELLRSQGALRCALALGAPLAGVLLKRHWIHQQRVLRDGLPLPSCVGS